MAIILKHRGWLQYQLRRPKLIMQQMRILRPHAGLLERIWQALRLTKYIPKER